MAQSPGTSFPFSVFCGLETWFCSTSAKVSCLGALDGLLFYEFNGLLFDSF